MDLWLSDRPLGVVALDLEVEIVELVGEDLGPRLTQLVEGGAGLDVLVGGEHVGEGRNDVLGEEVLVGVAVVLGDRVQDVEGGQLEAGLDLSGYEI